MSVASGKDGGQYDDWTSFSIGGVPIEQNGFGFFFASVACIILAVTSYYEFLNADYFIYGFEDTSAWSTSSGYTIDQWIFLVLGSYLLPLAIIFMLLFASHSFTNIPHTHWIKSAAYISLSLTFAAFTGISYYIASDVLSCISYFCLGTDGIIYDDVSTTLPAGKIFIGMIYFFVSSFFTIIFIGLTGLLFVARSSINVDTAASLATSVSETRPLLSGSKKSEGGNTFAPRFTSAAASSSSTSSVPQPVRIREANRKVNRKWYTDVVVIALVFLILYPLLIFAATILPTWWNGFTKDDIQYYQTTQHSEVYGIYWYASMGSAIVKLYPDIVIYYGFIYFVVITALLARVWEPLRLTLHRRPVALRTWSIGEFALVTATAAMLIGEFCYWYFVHGWQNEARSDFSNAQLAARSMGQIANEVVGLLVLPVSKNSVWSAVFGISWESMIVYHQILGYTLLAVVAAHMFLWWVVFSQQGTFPHDIFAVPLQFYSDDFTVPLSILTYFFMIVIFGCLTFYVVRRYHYELFYFMHFFSAVVFLVMLWHATMSWYYITAGLALYTLDVALRLTRNVATAVEVEGLSVAVSETAAAATSSSSSSENRQTAAAVSLDNGVVKLSYTVRGPLSAAKDPSNEKARAGLSHLAGQYCYVNVPSVSALEWHPFSISSAPCDSVTTHHIAVQGGVASRSGSQHQWTAKLYALAESSASVDPDIVIPSPLCNLKVNIDGPYGLPPAFENYTHVLLVGGGIGITPLHSCIRQMYLSARTEVIARNGRVRSSTSAGSSQAPSYATTGTGASASAAAATVVANQQNQLDDDDAVTTDVAAAGGAGADAGQDEWSFAVTDADSDSDSQDDPYASIESVRIVWSARSIAMATSLFADTIDMIAQDGLAGKFSASVHVTRESSSSSTSTSMGNSKLGFEKTWVHRGRPDLRTEISKLQHLGSKAIVYACGPTALLEECAKLTMEYGVDIRTEGFQI